MSLLRIFLNIVLLAVTQQVIKVETGAGCFLGANSIILKGTTLGKNVVVGAGSVVCGSFPDNVIIDGNPARIVNENEESDNLRKIQLN